MSILIQGSFSLDLFPILYLWYESVLKKLKIILYPGGRRHLVIAHLLLTTTHDLLPIGILSDHQRISKDHQESPRPGQGHVDALWVVHKAQAELLVLATLLRADG